MLYTNTKLIANKAAWENPEKRRKIESIALLLQAALDAGTKVGLKLNLPKGNLAKIIGELPALRKPTVSQLSDPAWVAVETIVDEKVVRDLIPVLKANQAEGIVEYPLNKVIA